MGFDDQVNEFSENTGGRLGLFAEGVNYKYLSGKDAILFRILPPYNYSDIQNGEINPRGWLPCRDPSGKLTDWGLLIKVCRMVGHGSFKTGNRRDFVSVKTLDEKAFCPIEHLRTVASQTPEWQYLVEDKRTDDDKFIESAPVSRVSDILLMNIVEFGDPNQEVKLGIASKSTSDALVNKKRNGLVHQVSNVSEAALKADWLCRWSVRDLTDPEDGPVIFVMKGPDKRYIAGQAEDPRTHVIRKLAIAPEALEMRYDLGTDDKSTILCLKTAEEQVKELTEIFNQRNAEGAHELELLTEAFGDRYELPKPPARKNRVAGGFEPPTTAAPPPSAGVYRRGPVGPSQGTVPAPEAAPAAPAAQPGRGPAPKADAPPPPAPAPGMGTAADLANQADEPEPTRDEPVVPGDEVKEADWRSQFVAQIKAK